MRTTARPTRRFVFALALCALLAPAASAQATPTDPLRCYFTVHVDPGPWNTPSGWQQCNFIMDQMAQVFENHGLRLYVAVSWNWAQGCATFGNTQPGTIGDLSARGHEIGLHDHGGAPITTQYAVLTLLAGKPPIRIDGTADPAVIVPLGIRIGGVGPGKDPATQLAPDITRAYRPDLSNPYLEDPSGPLLAMPVGSFEASGFEPDMTAEMTQALLHDLASVDAGKLHTHSCAVTHPDEFLGKTNAEILSDLAKFDAWLSAEIDPRVASGEIVWVNPFDFLATYEAWEAAGGSNADLFGASSTVDKPDWSVIDPSNAPLGTDRVAAIEPDGAGGFFIGAATNDGGGLHHVDSSGSFTTYLSGGPGTPLSDFHLFLFTDAAGRLWSTCATRPWESGSTGASVFDGSSFTNHPNTAMGLPLGTFVWEGAEDPWGVVWFGTSKGVARFDGSSWSILTPTTSPLSAERVFCVAVDPSGRKWFGTLGGGIDVLDDQGTASQADDVWTHYDQTSGLPSSSIRSITFNPDGTAWIGTHFGAALWDGSGFTVFDSTNSGLPNDVVTDVLVDSRGDVWFATYGGGAARFDPQSGLWETYRRASRELAGDHLFDVEEDGQGRILLAGFQGGGVAVFDPHLVADGAAHLGQPFHLELRGEGGEAAFLLLSAGTAEVEIAGAGTLLLDPTTLAVVPLGTLPASGVIALTVTVPNDPGLVTGQPVHLQGLRLSSASPPSGAFTCRESVVVQP